MVPEEVALFMFQITFVARDLNLQRHSKSKEYGLNSQLTRPQLY